MFLSAFIFQDFVTYGLDVIDSWYFDVLVTWSPDFRFCFPALSKNPLNDEKSLQYVNK